MKRQTPARVMRRVSALFSLFAVTFSFLLSGFPVPLHAELVGYWPFDGDGRSELIGNATQHGEIASTRNRSGKEGGAVQFDAKKKGYFSIALNAGGGFDQMKTGTFSLWVRWDDAPNLKGSDIEERAKEALNQPVSWSASHIQSGKRWIEVIQELPEANNGTEENK